MMRTLLVVTVASSLAASAVPAPTQAPQQPAAGHHALPPLPYPHDALAPVIDAETMRLHHGRHHQAYVDNLNKALTAAPALRSQSLDQLLARASTLPAAVRNNGGGHWNHSFFWRIMTRPDASGAPSPQLRQALARDFGSLDRMKAAFEAAGVGQFGSGWAWLIVRPDGRLAVTATPNQDNPLMDVAPERGVPILGNDVWEHAYYLSYNNRRADYLKAWWRVVDWTAVSRRYAEATAR